MGEKKFEATERMSLRAYKAKHNDECITIVRHPQTKVVFFKCGEDYGYVSKKLAAKLDTTSIDDIEYAKCVADDGRIIPCLFIASTENVLKSF